MQINDLCRFDGSIFRVLAIDEQSVLVIDCIKRQMPSWVTIPTEYTLCTEEKLLSETGVVMVTDEESLSQAERKTAHQRYTMIAPALIVIEDIHARSDMINFVSKKHNVSKPTLRKYLCLYLAFQNICILASQTKFKADKCLTDEQKVFRWALNKFYYTSRRNSLKTAYTMMLKEKYCDEFGTLLADYPPFHRFYYFYQIHNKERNKIISREGVSNYQRNHRPLLGDGVREYFPTIGYGLLDSTITDIYLVNESGQLVGRPILTVCVDAYSSLCMGYSLGWKGGAYSVAQMFQNVIADKVEHCKKYGIIISSDDWNCAALPATILTDRGKEYVGDTLEHLTDLGVTITNLPPFRAELKGTVEKFFDIIQNLYKPYLKGKGVVDTDYQERGAHDYRKDACLTITDFEKVILRCILYYNTQRIIENFPYAGKAIKPYANTIWNEFYKQGNIISVKSDLLYKTLLPRTEAKFTRHGLKVGRLHYKCLGFVEEYLRGDKAVVAYEPNDCSYVFLMKDSDYIRFTLIEMAFLGKSIEEAEEMIRGHSDVVNGEIRNNTQAKIDLAHDILAIANSCVQTTKVTVKGVRKTRQREARKP
ncbi:MAG: hypothetical protein K2O04_06885 [Clostridiales bacterium]|nr:hypothetical protein [Clostridiales bacterium]